MQECFARLGGDEFIIVFQRNESELVKVLQKIHKNIRKEHRLLGEKIYFSVSMGQTQLKVKDPNIDAAIKRADLCLYEEKLLKQHTLLEYSI